LKNIILLFTFTKKVHIYICNNVQQKVYNYKTICIDMQFFGSFMANVFLIASKIILA